MDPLIPHMHNVFLFAFLLSNLVIIGIYWLFCVINLEDYFLKCLQKCSFSIKRIIFRDLFSMVKTSADSAFTFLFLYAKGAFCQRYTVIFNLNGISFIFRPLFSKFRGVFFSRNTHEKYV